MHVAGFLITFSPCLFLPFFLPLLAFFLLDYILLLGQEQLRKERDLRSDDFCSSNNHHCYCLFSFNLSIHLLLSVVRSPPPPLLLMVTWSVHLNTSRTLSLLSTCCHPLLQIQHSQYFGMHFWIHFLHIFRNIHRKKSSVKRSGKESMVQDRSWIIPG